MSISNKCFAWRGPKGCGKKTQLIEFLKKQSILENVDFRIKTSTFVLNKSDDEENGKSIPYEESLIHLGFDVVRMSMSDKSFIQSILLRWSGNKDICLAEKNIGMRFLVLYHAHYLSDESILQLHEMIDKYPEFSILMTTELPIPYCISDFFLEIPVSGTNKSLENFIEQHHITIKEDVWNIFFRNTMENWASIENSYERVLNVREFVYFCLQRNLRWTDLIGYWIETISKCAWIKNKKELYDILWKFDSGSGWKLINTYRIPIMWENCHVKLSMGFYLSRQNR